MRKAPHCTHFSPSPARPRDDPEHRSVGELVLSCPICPPFVKLTFMISGRLSTAHLNWPVEVLVAIARSPCSHRFLVDANEIHHPWRP